MPSRSVTLPSACHFNPLPPHGGRPSHRSSPATPSLFQSAPSAWRETIENKTVIGRIRISIHSLRMEGDMTDLFTPSPGRYFNPLPPHGGRLYGSYTGNGMRDFNPLPPHGGRRHEGRYHQGIDHHFNPLPPHGGRPSV